MNTATNIIALDQDDEINKKACGRIVYWSLSGTVGHEALTKALKEQRSGAIPPEPPSALVALHRAVEAVARGSSEKADVHRRARGEWSIVGKGQVVDALVATAREANGQPAETEEERKLLAYEIKVTARLNGEELVVEGEGAAQIAAAYVEAKKWLSAGDIGSWLARKVEALGGVALRPSGGFYFIPKDRVESWSRIARAIAAASSSRVHGIPSMRSSEAVDAILSAVAEDTRAACEKIASEVPTAGLRALENRKEEVDALLQRVKQYEELLNVRLDDIKTAVDDTRNAVAYAALALGGEES